MQTAWGYLVIGSSIAPTTGLGDIDGEVSSTSPRDGWVSSSNIDFTLDTGVAQTFEVSWQWNVANAAAEMVRKYAVCTLT